MSALGNPAGPGRLLVVNGDDFGRSPGINRGVLECFDHGILTSASLMTLWPSSAAAASAASARPDLAVGLHVDLGEWEYAGGAWTCTYLRIPLDDEDAVRGELDRQLRAFRRLLDRDPTHLDSHQHVHRHEPVTSILAELAERLEIPLRHYAAGVQFRGDFFGHTDTGESRPERLSVEALIAILDSVGPETAELCCHPGYADDLRTAYRRERAIEIETLCDPRVRKAISKRRIRLCSFAEVAGGHDSRRLRTEAPQPATR